VRVAAQLAARLDERTMGLAQALIDENPGSTSAQLPDLTAGTGR
jgi:hypothetical protein